MKLAAIITEFRVRHALGLLGALLLALAYPTPGLAGLAWFGPGLWLFAALGLRDVVGHWGPLIHKAAEVRSDCRDLLLAIEQIVDAPQQINIAGGIPMAMAAPAALAAQTRGEIARKFMERVELAELLPINNNLTSAKEQTMISLLGSPEMPLTTAGQNERASPLVR